MKIKYLALAVAAAVSVGAQAAPASLAAGDIQTVIGDNGVFYPGDNTTPSIGLTYKGVEFINIDNIASWGVLSAGGTDFVQSTYGSFGGNVSTNDLGSATAGPLFGGTTTLVSSFGNIAMSETVRITSSNTLSFSWTFTNTSSDAVRDVKWSFGFDPDQGGPGVNATTNTILGTGVNSAVSATNGYTVTLFNTTRAAPTDIAAFINTSFCCNYQTAANVFAGAQAVGFTNLGDDSINLGWNLGTLAAGGTLGDSATIGASLVFAVPEPETYALFLAGLGLMGAIARRRTRA